MEPVNNNLFEVKPTSKSKRKIIQPCPNAYLNPALDLLANEDPMCNTAMEIPVKKRKRTRSLDIATFENSALDLGISKVAVNEFLVRELENVKKNLRSLESPQKVVTPIMDRSPKVHKPILKATFQKLPELPKRIPLSAINKEKSSISLPDISISENLTELNNITELLETDVDADTKIDDYDANFTKFVNNIDFVPQVNDSELIYSNLTKVNTHITDNINYRTNNNEEQSIIEDNTLANTNNMQSMDISNTGPFTLNDTNIQDIESMEITKDEEIDSGISVLEQKSLAPVNELQNNDLSAINNITNIQSNVTNQVFINNPNISLSFIDRLALDSPNMSNQSLYLDDDLNESNIMEIKTITIITKTKRIPKKNTNPFLDPNLKDVVVSGDNPFLDIGPANAEMEYSEEVLSRPVQPQIIMDPNNIMPRRLFTSDINSTISTVNESTNTEFHEYENIDAYRQDSPIYENIFEDDSYYNKQSKILGHDVSKFSAIDIMNLNKNSQANSSNESSDAKKDLKHILKAGKKVFKTLKNKFKHDKGNENKNTNIDSNVTLNPYEVPRKPPKEKIENKDSGIENPGLHLDNSDEIEIEELDDEEHQYETIKTIRNTRLNMNVTPLKERGNENADLSHNKTNTPSKKVRFDSTLNQEKVITGNSFDYGVQSPGFDAKIDKYHDELENCINERKFLQQNM